MINQQKPTIKLSEETKKKLDEIKLIPQEPYESVIIRLYNHYKMVKLGRN